MSHKTIPTPNTNPTTTTPPPPKGKKPYHKPQTEIIRFTTEDIIMTSGFGGLHDGGTGTGEDNQWPF